MLPILYIVIPCYNEEAVLPITSQLFLNKVEELIARQQIEIGRASCRERV